MPPPGQMARRKGKKRSRRRKTFSLLNALEAYVYATILTEGVAGTSPYGFITGAADIGMKQIAGSPGMREAGTSMTLVGAGQISLGDIISQPDLALGQMAQSFQSNLAPMAIAAFGTSITFRIGKRLLRGPISNINRNIVKPALGAGIRL